MSDEESPIPFPVREASEPPRARPRVKKLRLALILFGIALLAIVSTVFGMMMAVASDLPALENRQEYKTARNSQLLDVNKRPMGILTSNQNRVLVGSAQIAPVMKQAIVAIEDKRFYTNSGVDIRGIARAFIADLTRGRAVQGASTITQQFVKNALQAQTKRTVFQKLREAALAYHLTHKWTKDRILTEYLNSIYFGNGAYGVEAAARTYFGRDPNHVGCGLTLRRQCASELKPQEAALLAGLVASPSAYDPVSHPRAALARRNQVLAAMRDQNYLTPSQYTEATVEAPPDRNVIQPPGLQLSDPSTGYFTSWVRQIVVDHYGARRAFEGGLKIRTTLDLDMQRAAQQAVNNHLASPLGPTAALVALDNATGEVRAMIGGRSYRDAPFNLATQGQRQPGSAFKPFVLAQALREGVSPDSVWPSRKRIFTVPNTRGKEHFVVNNYEGNYSGSSTLARALTYSDNSVFAAVGIKVGTPRIAALAERMGIRTPVSHNYAIALGGLRHGVTPLDMAHAYETFAQHGQRITGSFGASGDGPVGIHEVEVGHHKDKNHVRRASALSPAVAGETTRLMATVIAFGTGTRAQVPEFAAGKTGTTENYGDAWFVGFTQRYTVAVWVGYPNQLRSMKTDYGGQPVAGGTYPALIWHDFMTAVEQLNANRAAAQALKAGKSPTGPSGVTGAPAAQTPAAPATGATPSAGGAPPAAKTPAARKPAPAKKPAQQPTPAPPVAPSGGVTPPPGAGTGNG